MPWSVFRAVSGARMLTTGPWEARGVPARVRPSRPEDGAELRQIERLAGQRFREVGLAEVADDEPPSLEVLAEYARAGRGWVAVDENDEPVGYVVVDVVDDQAHIEQVSVHPDHQGAGVGRTLIERVAAWGAETGRAALTLTTFADVAWNGPLYEHLGFSVVTEEEIGPELRAVREVEAAHGLDPARRVCMRLDLPGPAPR